MLEMPVPPVPVFDESIEAVAARIQKLVGKVPCQRNFDKAFGDIAKLLSHDEERRKNAWSYDKPKYETGIERRRLLILNSIFLAVCALSCKASMNTSKYGVDDLDRRGIVVTVGSQHVYFTLEQPVLKARYDRPDPNGTTLTLAFGSRGNPTSPDLIWKDTDNLKLEAHLRDIVIAILLQAEKQHRQAAVRHREWIIERKAEIQKALERERIDKNAKSANVRSDRRKREWKRCFDRLPTCKRLKPFEHMCKPCATGPRSFQPLNQSCNCGRIGRSRRPTASIQASRQDFSGKSPYESVIPTQHLLMNPTS